MGRLQEKGFGEAKRGDICPRPTSNPHQLPVFPASCLNSGQVFQTGMQGWSWIGPARFRDRIMMRFLSAGPEF